MRCSVVIPCWNGAELTADCLRSLFAQRGDHELEIVLVDNGSTDATQELGAMDARIRLVRLATNRGFAGGVNAGVAASRLPFVLVLNNDTQAAPNLLDELHTALVSEPGIAAAAPLSNHVKGPALLPIGGRARDPAVRADLAAELGAADTARIQDVDTLAGLCLLLRRSTLDEVGPFDERFGHGNFEDDDLCLRLRLRGHRLVIARTAFLHHEGHATFRALGMEMREQIELRRAQFFAKWRNDPAGRAVIAAMRGDLATAAAASHEAKARWPLWPDADWHIAREFAARGEHAAAGQHFASFLRACPRHAEAAIEFGLQQLASGDRALAERQFAWAFANCHVDTTCQVHLLRRLGEHAHREHRWQEALVCFRDASDLAPDDGGLHNWIGAVHLELGDLAAATACFDAAIARGHALGHTNRGICRHRCGDDAGALSDFAKAMELLPEDQTARNNHAALMLHLSRRQLAGTAAS